MIGELWPITLLLLAFIIAALVRTVLHSDPVDWARLRMALLPFAFPAFLIAAGVVLNNPDGKARWSNTVGEVLIFATLIGQLIAMVVLPLRLRGARMVAIATSLLALWLSFCAAFIAAMSVNGDWL